MAFRNGRKNAGITRRQRRLLLRFLLAAAVAALIISRYTSPRSLFNPTSSKPPASERR
ncbi:MAG: hypothetical protein AB7E81_22080 [Hyphomicrobiaceae bacterium]